MFTLDDRFIVVDTETTNSLDDPLCYDVGFAVVDILGNVYENYSFVVADIFLDKELMTSAYFADKIPQYWTDIKNGTRELKTFFNIKKTFADCVKRNGVKIVLAHNARFDNRSLNLTQRYLTCSKYRYFFPFEIEIWDTLKMSREVLKNNDAYSDFCYNNDFEESHTGLEDVLIEKEIFVFCVSVKPEIDGALWARG